MFYYARAESFSIFIPRIKLSSCDIIGLDSTVLYYLAENSLGHIGVEITENNAHVFLLQTRAIYFTTRSLLHFVIITYKIQTMQTVFVVSNRPPVKRRGVVFHRESRY